MRSTDEFITVLKCSEPRGIVASLDVQSLFTNVPVKETVDMLLNYVYENNEIHPPRLPRYVLQQLLLACTTEAPFRSPDGKLYKQVDGVAMGSPLGVLFANAYMCYIEQEVLNDIHKKPYIYKRYIDDIFVQIDSEEQLQGLQQKLESASVLKFTYELGVNGKLPFLDVHLDISDGRHETTVYRKKTDGGRCLNALSECPAQYKRGVIRAYVRRAVKYCSTWETLHEELKHVKQMLTNNNYRTLDIDEAIQTALNNFMNTEHSERERTVAKPIVLYYGNQMNTAHRVDERVLKGIVFRNVTPIGENKLEMRIYYKNKTTSNLVMKNNMKKESKFMSTNVIYHWTCPNEGCKLRNQPVDYIGRTRTTLSRRLTMHLHDHPHPVTQRTATTETSLGRNWKRIRK